MARWMIQVIDDSKYWEDVGERTFWSKACTSWPDSDGTLEYFPEDSRAFRQLVQADKHNE